MTLEEVMMELKAIGSEQTKKTLMRHGAPEPLFGVKIGDMKHIVKKVRKNHELSMALFDTGNSDARYLAGLIADEKKISKKDLEHWVKNANWQMLSEYTVPWVAAESHYGFELAKEWITNKEECIASAGWACLSSIATITDNAKLDIEFFRKCLLHIGDHIHRQADRVRYTMNNFIIATGSAIPELTDEAKRTAKKVGTVAVIVEGTACRVPDAITYIEKVEKAGAIGKKKKMARC